METLSISRGSSGRQYLIEKGLVQVYQSLFHVSLVMCIMHVKENNQPTLVYQPRCYLAVTSIECNRSKGVNSTCNEEVVEGTFHPFYALLLLQRRTGKSNFKLINVRYRPCGLSLSFVLI